MTHGNAPRCPKCGTANFTIRKVCRNEECAHDLVLHPERDIDDAVRWDAEDARRYDDAAMAEPRTP